MYNEKTADRSKVVTDQSGEAARLGFGEIEKHQELLDKVSIIHFSGFSPVCWSELLNAINCALVRERNDSYQVGFKDGKTETAN